MGRRLEALPDVPQEAEVDGRTNNQRAQVARRRAERRIAALHSEEFAVVFHEEKHRIGEPHRHGPNNPETLTWWGDVAKERGDSDG